MGPRGAAQRVWVVWGCRRVPAWRLAHWGTAVLAVWRQRQDVGPDLRRDDMLCMRWSRTDVRIAQSNVAGSTIVVWSRLLDDMDMEEVRDLHVSFYAGLFLSLLLFVIL